MYLYTVSKGGEFGSLMNDSGLQSAQPMPRTAMKREGEADNGSVLKIVAPAAHSTMTWEAVPHSANTSAIKGRAGLSELLA